jgi:hypothetical protein
VKVGRSSGIEVPQTVTTVVCDMAMVAVGVGVGVGEGEWKTGEWDFGLVCTCAVDNWWKMNVFPTTNRTSLFIFFEVVEHVPRLLAAPAPAPPHPLTP